MEIVAKEMERNGIGVFSRGVFKIIELAQSVSFFSFSHENGMTQPFSTAGHNTTRLSLCPTFNLSFTHGQRYSLNGHT